MNKEQILGLVRHALTIIGGGLVTSGKLDVTQLETIIGLVLSAAGLVWSFFSKTKVEPEVK